jgi:hypothetical protein
MRVKRAQIYDLGLGELVTVSYTPANVSIEGTRHLFEDVPESVKVYARSLRDNGWRFYVCDQQSGWCIGGGHKMIIIPLWLIDINHKHYTSQKVANKPGYKTYYIAHEMAHAFAGVAEQHGPRFMEWLKKICPSELIHYELEYKPRNAKSAGIGVKSWNDLLGLD